MATLAELIVRIGADARAFERDIAKVEGKIKRLGNQFQDVGRRLTTGLTLPIAALGGGALKAAIDFESAFAGVRKTVDATEEQFAQLREGILDMAREVPAAQTEIAKVAEIAGQLGIETENVLKFTRTMIDLGVSTNLSAEEAADALARLANITRMPQDQFDRLGSTVVALGNAFAASESQIIEMALRLAGAGAQVGMTEDQILALATALSSVGMEAEAGGSALSRVMIEIANAVATGNEKLALFAQVAGLTVPEFARLWREDAAQALLVFLQGLNQVSAAGGNVFGILEALGLSETRVRDALLRSMKAHEDYARALSIGNQAWRENVALTNEAGQRYATTESQLQLLKNEVVDLAIRFGEQLAPALRDVVEAVKPVLDRIRQLVEWFAALPPSTQQMIIEAVALTAALGPLAYAVGGIIQTFSGLLGVVRLLSGGTGIAGLIGLGARLANAFMLWRVGVLGFGAALRLALGPVGLVITALQLLVVAGIYVYRNWDTIKERAGQLWEYLRAGFEGVVARISYAWNRIVQIHLWAIDKVLALYEPITRLLPESWQAAFQRMRAAVQEHMEAAARKAEEAAGRISAATTRMAVAFKSASDEVPVMTSRLAGLRKGASQTAEQVQTAADQVIESSDRVSAGFADLGASAESAADKIRNQLDTALSALDNRIRIVEQSLELFRLQNNLAEDSVAFLSEKLKAQGQILKLLGQQIAAVEAAYAKAVAAKGADSEAALELQAKLLGLRVEQERLRDAIEETTRAMQEQTRAMGGPSREQLDLFGKALERAGGFDKLVREAISRGGQIGLDPVQSVRRLMEGFGARTDEGTARRILRQVGIPGFADGGIVPGPIGAPRLIMAHGGELVLNRDQQRALRGGPTIIVTGNTFLSEGDMMRFVNHHLGPALKRWIDLKAPSAARLG